MFNNAHVVSATTPAERERIELSAAINTWKRVNRCAESTNGANCPPLVLIAGQGGASRSAFFTGSVLGHILDENGANSVDRIFAMSGVSGGSVGFAFFSAALFDNQRLGSVSPCRTLTELGTSTKRTYFGLAGFHNWFRSSAYRVPEKDWLWQSLGLTKLEDPPYEPAYNHYWRYCMEVLASGDFLSPVFLKMSGTDFFSLNRVLGNVSQKLAIDRAAVLRRSWEDHYRRITGSNTLTRNFLDFAPSPTAPNQWRPILLMNATSANDGKRVIASHLYPAYCDGNGWRRRIFNDAYDLHEVFSAQRLRAAGTRDGTPEFHYDSDDCKCDPETRALLCERRPKYDFELSTAASLSSRFPVISPQADLIAAGDDNNVRARVVDGGHFENYGASSLLDLVTAIRWIQTELPIHVIMITNDPTLEPGNCLEVKPKRLNAKTEWSPIKDRSNNLPPSEQYRLAPGFTTVFDAALQTRVARGMNAAINLCKTQWTLNRITFTHIGVTRLGIRDISMSWWLSYPVQLYLDSQLAENRESFNFISQILHEKSSR